MFTTLQLYIILALSVLALGMEIFALVDCVRRKSGAFVAAGKLTKQLWLIILAVATAFGFIALPPPLGIGFNMLGLLSIAGVVASAVYLTDVRPAVRGTNGGGGRSGPYGPW
jgi:uncharacterized membrane protein YeiB